MLLHPRAYHLLHHPHHHPEQENPRTPNMLLVHQAGSVKVGEVIRYTLTYTPSSDRILPTPPHLHLKVRNTSAIPLRAAWLHGPYVLHVAAYPKTFNPHRKVTDAERARYGVPDYEPMLKAGGSWSTRLTVPGDIRETGADLGRRRQSSATSQAPEQEQRPRSMTWVIEIHSQVLFSATANVHFELLIGRDERSLDLGFAAVAGHGQGAPGHIREQQTDERERRRARRAGNVQTAGVYSKAVRLVVEDTETLWDKPALPAWDDGGKEAQGRRSMAGGERGQGEEGKKAEGKEEAEGKPKKRKKIHLVILTHGLHSNIGADMLFLKESIDATVAQARVDAKKRKESYRKREAERKRPQSSSTSPPKDASEAKRGEDGIAEDQQDTSTAPLSGGQEELDGPDGSESTPSVEADHKDEPPDEEEPPSSSSDDDDEEETIVRGFPGNAVRTEKGIQYLGKRLAKYILRFTYPDQPFLPMKKTLTRHFTDSFKSTADKTRRDGLPSHTGSSIHSPQPHAAADHAADDLPYRFTSISFIGHSLGGLIQTYAIAYIHKHSPDFFRQIRPVNFVTLASPMLGLSNENPLYVKFALDFGLVGRTGQDLGLSFRPVGFARGGWNAVIGGLGGGGGKEGGAGGGGAGPGGAGGEDPTAKPLLRILPTGPAHQVLRMFRRRTVYSNVVNDGIVPLRTSCLLFLDWRGLGRVEKARRENGLIGTVAEWGWNELMGSNSTQVAPNVIAERDLSGGEGEGEGLRRVRSGEGETVPLPAVDETTEDSRQGAGQRMSVESEGLRGSLGSRGSEQAGSSKGRSGRGGGGGEVPQQEKGVLDTFLDWFRPNPAPGKQPTPASTSKKTQRALQRGQTMHAVDPAPTDPSAAAADDDNTTTTTTNPTMRPHLTHHHTGVAAQFAPVHPTNPSPAAPQPRPAATKGDSYLREPHAPPKTSIFESAGDILHPPLPSRQWITDPGTRARTIFHDRVYYPEDIPPVVGKRVGSGGTGTGTGSVSGGRLARVGTNYGAGGGGDEGGSVRSGKSSGTAASSVHSSTTDGGGGGVGGGGGGSMKVEEKIARAYHRDLSWRKVLVRLEPDAHNNLIVRRMFANAYGWPVVRHLCEVHFGVEAGEEEEGGEEKAERNGNGVGDGGGAVPPRDRRRDGEGFAAERDARTGSEAQEARDAVADLSVSREGVEGRHAGSTPSSTSSGKKSAGSAAAAGGAAKPPLDRNSVESGVWDDAYFDDDDEDDDEDGGGGGGRVDDRNLVQKLIKMNPAQQQQQPRAPESAHHAGGVSRRSGGGGGAGASSPTVRRFADGHRGLGPASPRSPRGEGGAGAGRKGDAAVQSPQTPGPPVVADEVVEEPGSLEERGGPAGVTSGLGGDGGRG